MKTDLLEEYAYKIDSTGAGECECVTQDDEIAHLKDILREFALQVVEASAGTPHPDHDIFHRRELCCKPEVRVVLIENTRRILGLEPKT